MAITRDDKKKLFAAYGHDPKDTGSSPVQIAIFTFRINQITDHLKSNKKDHHARRGLLKLVGKRRSLLDYLRQQDSGAYDKLIEELGLRK